MLRRNLLATGATLLAAPAFAQNAPIKMTIATGVDPSFAPYYVAREGGFFTRNGLDCTVNTGPSGSAMVAFLIGNQINSAYGAEQAGVSAHLVDPNVVAVAEGTALLRWISVLGGQRILGVQHAGDRMHHGGDADGRLHLFLAQAAMQHDLLMRLHAHAAAIDGRDGERPQLEIHLVDAGLGHDVHAQLGRHGWVVAADQVGEAVIDVVHAHDRGRGLGGGQRLGRQLRAELGEDSARVSSALRLAIAAATKVPARCCWSARARSASEPRLSFRSLA
jgi:hypothetical protein